MSRLVWFGLGAVTGGWVMLRGRDKARELAALATPANLGRHVGRGLGRRKVEVSENVADFFTSLAEGARTREYEMRTTMLMPADHPSTRP